MVAGFSARPSLLAYASNSQAVAPKVEKGRNSVAPCQRAAGLEDERVITQIRKPVSSAARVATVGLLSLGAIGAWAQNVSALPAEPVLMGQIEVTAPALRVAMRSITSPESAPMVGSMTVTATRLSSLAERREQPASTGELPVRSGSPRAVLVR